MSTVVGCGRSRDLGQLKLEPTGGQVFTTQLDPNESYTDNFDFGRYEMGRVEVELEQVWTSNSTYSLPPISLQNRWIMRVCHAAMSTQITPEMVEKEYSFEFPTVDELVMDPLADHLGRRSHQSHDHHAGLQLCCSQHRSGVDRHLGYGDQPGHGGAAVSVQLWSIG